MNFVLVALVLTIFVLYIFLIKTKLEKAYLEHQVELLTGFADTLQKSNNRIRGAMDTLSNANENEK